MKALIVDDEPLARRELRRLLAAFDWIEIIGEASNINEAQSAVDALSPDLLFLDIQMPGVDGFAVIRRRPKEHMPAVVFLTAYDQFAVQAFEAEAIDYLLKPVTAERFAATIGRIERRLAAGPGASREPTIAVPTSRGTVIVPVREIDLIESADNYARIWTHGRSYLVRESMRTLEDRVQGEGFVRAHRQALVRVDDIRELDRDRDGGLNAVLASGARVPIGRRRRAAVLAALKRP
jgi:two-component system LytT family response regulator